jgi:hypothetical protein
MQRLASTGDMVCAFTTSANASSSNVRRLPLAAAAVDALLYRVT